MRIVRRNPLKTRLAEQAAFAALALALAGGTASAQDPPTQQPPVGTQSGVGALALPKDAPPVGQQAPLPKPVKEQGKLDKPLLKSPTLEDLAAMLAEKPLTLDEAVSLALYANRNLATAGANLLRAQGRVGEARAAFNPTVGATFQYLRLNRGQSANINGVNIPFVNADQKSITGNATLPIDISGLLRAATDQAKYQEISARLDINRTRNEVVIGVKTAFYDVLRAQAQVAVYTDNLQNSLFRLGDAQKKFTAGTVARFDVIRAQTDVLNAQQQLIQSRNTVSSSIATLNSQIGIDVNTPLKITSQGAIENPPGVAPPSTDANAPQNQGNFIPIPEPKDPNKVDQERDPATRTDQIAYDPLELGPAYNQVLKEALDSRPEILQADATISAAKRGILLARRSTLPGLNINFGYSYTPDAVGFSPQINGWQATAAITVPFYDGGVARERVKQARADVAAQEVAKRNSVDQVTLDVRIAYLNLLQSRDRVAVSNQALVQARETFRLARVRYNAGVAEAAGGSPLLEVSDAQAALTQAESNQVNALYDYNNSRARLDRAIGRYSYMSSGFGFSAPPPAKLTGATSTPTTGDRK